MVAGKSADVGIAALDLNSGETVSIKATRRSDGEHGQGRRRRALTWRRSTTAAVRSTT